MYLQKVLIGFLGLLVLVPVYSDHGVMMEEPVRESEQSVAGNITELQIRRQQGTVEQRKHTPIVPDNSVARPVKAYGDEQQAAHARYEKYIQATKDRQQVEAARVAEWRAAESKYRAAQMDVLLKRQEDWQQQVMQRHEAMRNRAEEEHNYLVRHHEAMLEHALQAKIDYANRHEEMRQQAEERRKKLAVFRATMKGMTVVERRDYLQAHRVDLFGPDSTAPAHRAMYPPPRPWVQPPPAGLAYPQ